VSVVYGLTGRKKGNLLKTTTTTTTTASWDNNDGNKNDNDNDNNTKNLRFVYTIGFSKKFYNWWFFFDLDNLGF